MLYFSYLIIFLLHFLFTLFNNLYILIFILYLFLSRIFAFFCILLLFALFSRSLFGSTFRFNNFTNFNIVCYGHENMSCHICIKPRIMTLTPISLIESKYLIFFRIENSLHIIVKRFIIHTLCVQITKVCLTKISCYYRKNFGIIHFGEF